MTNGQTVLMSSLNGAITGAIAGAAAGHSDHPILKGALVAGLVSGGMTALFLATQTDRLSSGVSGALASHNPRWP